jgi:hypothetical protein
MKMAVALQSSTRRKSGVVLTMGHGRNSPTSTLKSSRYVPVEPEILCGGMRDAAIVRLSPNNGPVRLKSFDMVPGRSEWFAGGPPLGVRAITENSNGSTILAAVHVGGIPRSVDGGETWSPTIPVMFDVHEVRSHPYIPTLIAAAAAVGLCVSHDGGSNWVVFDRDLEEPKTALALAFLNDEVLFSVQESPFATRSRLWRWRIGGTQLKSLETDCLNGWKARSTRTRLRLGPAELPSSMAEEISGFLTRARATGGASRRACDMVSDY